MSNAQIEFKKTIMLSGLTVWILWVKIGEQSCESKILTDTSDKMKTADVEKIFSFLCNDATQLIARDEPKRRGTNQ